MKDKYQEEGENRCDNWNLAGHFPGASYEHFMNSVRFEYHLALIFAAEKNSVLNRSINPYFQKTD